MTPGEKKMEQWSREKVYAELTGILQTLFETDAASVTEQTRLYEDLGLDSIDAVDMIVQIQKKTGRRFRPEDFKQVKTVGDVVDVLMRLLANDAGENA